VKYKIHICDLLIYR